MSRSIHDNNEILIKSLRDRINDPSIIPVGLRRIFLNEENGKVFFEKATLVESIEPTFGLKFAYVNLAEKHYIIVIGSDDEEIMTFRDLTEIDTNNGVLLFSFIELNLNIKQEIDGAYLLENIFIATEDDGGKVVNLGYEKLKPIFKTIRLFETNNEVTNGYLSKIAINFLCDNKHRCILPFENVLDDYRNIISGADSIPINNILRSMTASSWEYCFLDLYRCIEFLYEIGRVIGHYANFSDSLKFDCFYGKIKPTMVGRASEEDSLEKLLSILDDPVKRNLESVKECPEQKIHNFIYKLRNNIVHFRSDTSVAECKKDEWHLIIKFLISAIDDLYQRYMNVIGI